MYDPESELVNYEIGFFHESRKATASDWILGGVALVIIVGFLFGVLYLHGIHVL